jgi:hypothetical protein
VNPLPTFPLHTEKFSTESHSFRRKVYSRVIFDPITGSPGRPPTPRRHSLDGVESRSTSGRPRTPSYSLESRFDRGLCRRGTPRDPPTLGIPEILSNHQRGIGTGEHPPTQLWNKFFTHYHATFAFVPVFPEWFAHKLLYPNGV